MAVYTDVSFEALSTLLERYDIGAPIAFKGIAEGVENSNFLLRTTQGNFILTLYEKRVAATDLPFFLGLLEHLAAHGITCPQPVKNREGTSSTELNRRPAAILTFLEGLSLRHPLVTHCEAAGEALAKLHLAGADFPLTRRNDLGPAGWGPLALATRDNADGVQPGLAHLIETACAQLIADWPDHLPSGIVHADLFPDNVLFMADQVSGLIDFYFACHDAYAYDLSVMLNAWCFEADGAFNTAKSQALLRGYRRQRVLSSAEIAAMPQLCAGSALRFMLTRLYDWLHRDDQALVKPKDPREFARALRFHLAIQSPEPYGF